MCNCLITHAVTHMFRSRLSGIVTYCSNSSVTDRIVSRTFQIFGSFLTWCDLKILASSSILGALNSLVLAKILADEEYSSFFEYNNFPSINPRLHILTYCGAFMGLVFCFTVLILNKLTLNYCHPAESVFSIAKDHVMTRVFTTVGRMLYFILLCAMCPNHILGSSQNVSFFWIVVDKQLLLLMFLTTFHLHFCWSCAIDILKSQFLKPVDIPLLSVIQPSHSVQGILSNSSNTIEQHLVFERLADLVATSQSVRSSIFSLSHIGGRPVVWKQISNLCIHLIDQFVTNVQMANNCGINNLGTPLWPKSMDIKYKQHLPSSFKAQIRQRNITTTKASVTTDKSWPNPQPNGSIILQNFINAGRTLFSKVCPWILQTPVVSVLSSEIAYASTAHLFATATDIDYANSTNPSQLTVQTSGQIIIWATEVLACLTLSAYTEDPFGTVQQSLGQILLLFADALEAVEKHLKLVGLIINQYKQMMNGSVTDNHQTTSSISSTDNIQTPLRNSKQVLNNALLTNDQCKFAYYRFASDPSLPWRVYATFCWALTNCLNQYGDYLETISLSNTSRERLQMLKMTRCCTA
uniref:Nucleoporin NDC1 n=1 Tax=Trichobilharzia regenti TaxID=157069 RepID=A0AA85JBF7_TRIRE|nr:unnamed protein product [Trichobilharzia regenti]